MLGTVNSQLSMPAAVAKQDLLVTTVTRKDHGRSIIVITTYNKRAKILLPISQEPQKTDDVHWKPQNIPLSRFGAAAHAQDTCKDQNMCRPRYQCPL